LDTLVSIQPFTYNAQAGRVLFGAGSRSKLAEEIERLGAKRALILSTPEQKSLAQSLADELGGKAVGVFDRAVMHVPIETAREAREIATQLGADCAVAIGGGSTTGLGKAIALESGLPILAIPTTYAGSEMTSIFGITEGGIKKTGKDIKVLPRTVIYDPELTLSLPVQLSITSAMNAIAHAAEGLYAQDQNPIMNLMAEEGIRALAQAMPSIHSNPHDLAARGDALYGAWLCGSVLGNVGMALHHKLCHTLGGSFSLPHAEVHTVVLPHAIAFNSVAIPKALARMQNALMPTQNSLKPQGTVQSAASALFDLAKNNGAPVSLKEIGMKAEDLDRAADLAISNPYWNPRPIGPDQRTDIRELLQRAFEGTRPD
jgi:maleylacetate reductase